MLIDSFLCDFFCAESATAGFSLYIYRRRNFKRVVSGRFGSFIILLFKKNLRNFHAFQVVLDNRIMLVQYIFFVFLELPFIQQKETKIKKQKTEAETERQKPGQETEDEKERQGQKRQK